MVSESTIIRNKSGLHARPASDFVQAANKFTSSIKVQREEKKEDCANAKSILEILMLGLFQGEKIVISAEGNDEKAAVSALIALVDSGFGE